MRVLLVLSVLLVGCGGRSSMGGDAAAPDTRVQDQIPVAPDHRPGDVICPEACPATSGSKICLQGHVFRAPALMAYWAGDETLADLRNPNNGALITTSKDDAVVKVFDPMDFVSNPSGSQPLAEVDIDERGCFIVKNLSIPFSNLLAITVDDKLTSGTTWAFAGMVETPTVGINSTSLVLPAVSEQTVADWGHNFLADGTMLALFSHKYTRQGVEGVVPTLDGKPPVGSPGSWKFEGTDMDVFYVATDPTDAKAIVDTAADATTRTGMVFIRKAGGTFGGTKPGCTIESKPGFSCPGSLFFRIYDVEDC